MDSTIQFATVQFATDFYAVPNGIAVLGCRAETIAIRPYPSAVGNRKLNHLGRKEKTS